MPDPQKYLHVKEKKLRNALQIVQLPESRLHEATERFGPASRAEVEEAVPHSLLFTIVRHPFERLVSAFR